MSGYSSVMCETSQLCCFHYWQAHDALLTGGL